MADLATEIEAAMAQAQARLTKPRRYCRILGNANAKLEALILLARHEWRMEGRR